MSEERYLDLNEEENIRMEYIKEEHCRDFSDNGDNKNNIHALR